MNASSPIKSIHEGLAGGSASPGFPTQQSESPFSKTKSSTSSAPTEGVMPGYQGFIRGHEHFYGSTYGEMTRSASDHNFGTTFYGSPIEEKPSMVTQPFDKEDATTYRVPGYSGHIPGSKYEFSNTFGKTTEKLVSALDSTDKTPKVRVLTTSTTEMPNAKNTVVSSNESKKAESAEYDHESALAQRVPGYAGFIRGSQHFYGSTYGTITSIATQHDFSQPQVTSGLPSSPHMVDIDPKHRPANRPPGYSGHLPGRKFEYGQGFGSK